MDQHELAKRHEARKSMPEQHKCCHAALRYLRTLFSAGQWRWFISPRCISLSCPPQKIADLLITHCPWCGEMLPDRGRLVVEEAAYE